MITIGLLLLTLYATTSVKGTPEYRTAVAVKCGIEDFSDPIPVGVKSYKELVKTSKMFVDNSLLIEEIIRNETKTKTIIGPRKFGKTLNLDMIRIFFEIQAHKNGTEIPLKFTFGYNLFQKGKIIMGDGKSQKLDSPLLISQRRELLDEYQGRVPVIFLNLKNVTGNNYDEVEKSLHRLIAKAYQQYSYVVSNITDSEDQSKYRDFSNGVPQNTSTIIKSLQFLCEHVRNYFRRAPLLIFDDYESALYNIIYAEKFPRKDINAVSHLTISLLNTSFDGNPNIWKGIIMGTFKVYPEVIDSAENLACYDRYDTYYYNIATKRDLITYYFGFHLKDVLLLFQEHKIHGELAELAHKWYNGYIDPSKEHRFYNPYSIASFLKTKEIKTYWKGDYIKPEKIDKFMHDSHLEVVILSLLSKCTSSYNMPLVLDEINISYLKTFNGTQDEGECFYSYLMDQGYFAPLNSTNPRYIEVVLANYEMGYQLITWILNYYRDRGDVREDLVNECANKLLDFFYSDSINGTELANSVTKLYWNCAPYNLTVLSHSIFYCIALKMQCLTKFQIEGYYAHVLRGDVVLADNRTGRGAIIQLRMNYEDPVNYDLLPTDYVKEHFDVRIEDDLKTAESFKYNFEEHTSFRLHTKKFIAVKFSYRFPTRVLAKIERRQLLS